MQISILKPLRLWSLLRQDSNTDLIKRSAPRGALSKLFLFGSMALSLMLPGFAYAGPNSQDNNHFQFAVVADTGYSATHIENAEEMFRDQLNHEKLAFVAHLGDIKGPQKCTQENRDAVRALFDSSKNPVVYTPGDNEWTDCSNLLERFSTPRSDPLAALEGVRNTFYRSEGNRSLGQKTIKLERQSDDNGYELYVENQLWSKGKIVFGTIHVPGSTDNCIQYNEDGSTEGTVDNCSAEKQAREVANLAWLEKIFELADEKQARGVVIFLHADMYFADEATPEELSAYYGSYLVALEDASKARPDMEILQFYGDEHDAKTFQPFGTENHLSDPGPIPWYRFTFSQDNFTAVETYGFPDTGWLRVTVDMSNPNPFSIQKGGVVNIGCVEANTICGNPQEP